MDIDENIDKKLLGIWISISISIWPVLKILISIRTFSKISISISIREFCKISISIRYRIDKDLAYRTPLCQGDWVIIAFALVGRDFEHQTWQAHWVIVEDKIGWVMNEYTVLKVPSKHQKELVLFIVRSNLPMNIEGISSSVP